MFRRDWLAMLRAPADEGGKGGDEGGDDKADAAGADEGKADEGGKTLAQIALEAAGDDEGGKADDKGGDDDAAGPYKPEGLADNLIGDSDQDTIDNLAKALKGFQKTASRKGVPDKADDYRVEPEGDDDLIGHGLNGENMKGVMDRARAAAHKAGVPADAFGTFVREFAGADGDLEWLLPDDEAAKISGRREFQALVEDVGSEKAANEVMAHVTNHWNQLVDGGAFTGKLTANGVEPGTDGEEFAIMMGTARGARILAKLISSFTGKDPIPTINADLTVTQASLDREMAAVMKMAPGPEKDAAHADLLKKFEQVHPG